MKQYPLFIFATPRAFSIPAQISSLDHAIGLNRHNQKEFVWTKTTESTGVNFSPQINTLQAQVKRLVQWLIAILTLALNNTHPTDTAMSTFAFLTGGVHVRHSEGPCCIFNSCGNCTCCVFMIRHMKTFLLVLVHDDQEKPQAIALSHTKGRRQKAVCQTAGQVISRTRLSSCLHQSSHWFTQTYSLSPPAGNKNILQATVISL